MIVKVGNLLADHPRQGIQIATAFYKMIMKLKFSENRHSSLRQSEMENSDREFELTPELMIFLDEMRGE
jgi:hypothetical protein